MDKLKMHSNNITGQNIEKIEQLFPNCITEIRDKNGIITKAIDFDLLKQELSTTIVEGPQERYQLNWPGKREALLTANAPIAKTLRPCRDESVNFDTTENIFIEGDNLDALKLLQETYLGKVKMIYIDPPYNTGKDFIYSDNFTKNTEEYLQESNQKDDEGYRLKTNPESEGRFHSKWLSMMYSRLKLARNLLKDDGVIFISIDDLEVANLTKICNDIFGVDNKEYTFVWHLPRGINAGLIARSHEYILVYTKNTNIVKHFFVKENEQNYSIERCNRKIEARHPASELEIPAGIRYEGEDQIFSGKIEGAEEIFIKDKMVFENGKLKYPVTLTAGWTMKNFFISWLNGCVVKDTKGQIIEDFFFKNNGKLYSKKKMEFQSAKSIIQKMEDYQNARIEMVSLFESKDYFDYPKPSKLITYLSALCCNKNDIILDFFAGSSTTAHATMQLNAEDGCNRKFIMVQLPEECDEKSEAYKAGYKNIAEISKERIRRAGKQIVSGECNSGWNKDIGFRVLKVDTSNMEDVYYNPDKIKQGELLGFSDNIKRDRTEEDLLFQVLLDWGVDLTLPITVEEILGNKVYFVSDTALCACFDNSGNITESFVKELAKREPLRVVFRDSGFKEDDVKINVGQIFKQMSPHTEVKTI